MKCIAHPGGAHPERCQGLVILEPDLLVFERVGLAEFARDIPRQRIDLPALFHVLNDDREIGFLA